MVSALGGWTLKSFHGLFLFSDLFFQFVWRVVRFKFRFHETIKQAYSIAIESLPVIGFSLAFVSLMLILEFSFHMKLVLRHDSLVPAFSTVLMLRELGPVMTCLLLTSRVGAGIAAEIGTMKVTEQLDALRLLKVDPIEYLMLPRFFACVLAGVSLSIFSIGVAVLSGASIAWVSLGYSMDEFYNTMFTFTRFSDVVNCLLKGAVFGSIIPLIASYHGFQCKFGSEGVGNAATKAVVHGTLLIITFDFILTYLLYAL